MPDVFVGRWSLLQRHSPAVADTTAACRFTALTADRPPAPIIEQET